MHQIWTNPSLQRNIIRISERKAELINSLRLTILDPIADVEHNICLNPNMEYIFTYIDPDTGDIKSIKALADAFYHDCIKVKYLSDTSHNELCVRCPNYKKASIGLIKKCHCPINPPTISKYTGPQVLFIPINNIINVMNIPVDKYNGEVRVMLLGISAEIVKAIVIRMAIFDDKFEDAVKQVTLEVGKVYELTYESRGHIYTNKVKVISIEEDNGCPCSKPGNGYVREHVGMYNSIYVNINDATKEEFISANPVKKVKIIVEDADNTSEMTASIMLDCIRDCTLIDSNESGENNTGGDINNPICICCEHKTCGCNPSTCGHCGNNSNTDDMLKDAYLEEDTLIIP